METSVEKNDFQFHSLQKTRLFPSGTVFSISHDAICVSSVYQIAVASSGDNKLVSFNSSAIHTLRLTSQTTNREFTDLQKKVVELAAEDKVAALAGNSDGTLLAVLVNNNAGCFIYIYDMAAFSLKYSGDVYHVASIRLGAEEKTKGACLKWNPALADTLAASADDKSLMVAKIDPKNPTSYSLIGNKKMGAVVTHISWSPKGKQLTIGDAAGKVCQLKLELDVVRGTMPPDLPNMPKEHGAPVIGLCWISTTEWLVAYPGPNADTFVFLLTIKKDQQPTWKPLPELQYGNVQSTVGAFFSFETSLLLTWNLVLIASAKSSEIVVIGKTEDWKIWNLDDLGRLDLPTDSSTRETFPLGLCVDLSSSTQVALSDDGSRMHRACPIVLSLTTDGILTAHNVVSMDASHADCTIESADIPLASVKVGKRPVKAPLPKPTSLTDTPKSIFGSSAPAAAPAPLVIPTMKSVFGEAPPTPTAAFPPSDAKPFSFSSTQKPLFQPQASSTPLKPEVVPTVAANTAIPPMSATTTPIKPITPLPKKEEEDISAEVAAVNKVSAEIKQKWSLIVDDLRAISVGLSHTGSAVHEATDAIQSNDVLLLREFSNVMAEADAEYKKMESRIAVLIATMGAKHAKVDLYESDDERLRALHDSESFDIDEKMKRLTIKLDDAHEKYAEIKKKFDDCCKMKKKSLKPIPSLSLGDRDFISTQVKVIQKWTSNLKTKIEFIEEDLKIIKLQQKKNAQNVCENLPPPEIKVFESFAAPSAHGVNILEGRKRLINFLKNQKAAPLQIRKLNPVPFECIEENEKEKKLNAFENLKETLLSSILNSPQKNNDAALNVSRSDASTQIDAPPQIKIVEKEVPVSQTLTPRTPQLPPQTPFASLPKPTSPLAVKQEERPSIFAKPVVTPAPEAKEQVKKPVISPAPVLPVPEKKPPLTAKPSLLPETQTPPVIDLSPKTPNPLTPVNLTPKSEAPPAVPSVATPQKIFPTIAEEKPKDSMPIVPNEKPSELEKPQPVIPGTPEVKNIFSFSTPSSTDSPVVTSSPSAKPTFSFTNAAQSTPTSTQQSSEAPKFSFTQKPVETKTESPKPSIFNSPSTVQATENKSIFNTGNTSSIFGGGKQEQKSVFGQFPSAAQPSTAPTFSFKPKEPAATAPTPSTFSFSQKPSGASSGFMAAAKAAAEDGMMEEETTAQSGGGGAFGSFGSMSLGTANPPSANKGIFSVNNQPQQQQKSGLGLFSNTQKNPNAFGFTSAAQSTTKPSIFGQTMQTSGSRSIFGGGGNQPAPTKSIFGNSFGQAAQQAASSTTITNSAFNTTTPKFGAAAFGGAKQNVFGGKPVFANSSANNAAFGSGVAPPAGGGFAKYAASGNLFMAQSQQQQQQQQQPQNPSTFSFR